MTNINLEQLRTFVAIADCGGVNRAAETLFKSPSTVSHALTKLQQQLELSLFEQQGRRLVLTHQGTTLLNHARHLLVEKQHFLNVAKHLQQGGRGEVRLAIDTIYPHDLLLQALHDFADVLPLCAIKLHEETLSGAEEQLQSGLVDVCIAYRVPSGYLGEKLIDIPFVPVVHSSHPLAKKTAISAHCLSTQRQVVIEDSGQAKKVDSGWLGAKDRWTVSNMATAIDVVMSGMAFAWIPQHLIHDRLDSGVLMQLSLGFGGEKIAPLYIIMKDEYCSMSQRLVSHIKRQHTGSYADKKRQ